MLNLNQIADQFNTLMVHSKEQIWLIIKLLSLIWVINLANWAMGSVLNVLGTIPRNRRGLLGIVCSWFLHANFNHLFFNSIPLFVLSLLLISFNKKMFFDATILIILLEGVSVWLLGRRGNHIGASGLIAGYFGFSLVFAYENASIVSIFLSGILLYYFGSILLSLFPSEDRTSWESHLLGFITGIATYFLMFKYHVMPIYSIKSLLKLIPST